VKRNLLRLMGGLALAAAGFAAWGGVTTNCFNWAGPCPPGNECCEMVDTGMDYSYCKQLCAPYLDVGCCRWTARKWDYRPVGEGCCDEVNNGVPHCWIISHADNLGASYECFSGAVPGPCNTNKQGGWCRAKEGNQEPGG